MNPIALLFAIALIASCSDAPASNAPAGSETSAAATSGGGPDIEIADGRNLNDDASAAAPDSPTDGAMAGVYAAARTYWQSEDAQFDEETRVFSVADGAFTEAGAHQQAVMYLMSLWPRCCPKLGIAVFEGGRVVRNVALVNTLQELRTVPDLDGDGLDELAAIGTFGMGGANTSGLTLLSFAGGALHSLGGTMLESDDCAGSARESGSANLVMARPGTPPSFTVQAFTRATCEATTWDASGPPQPLVLSGADTFESHVLS